MNLSHLCVQIEMIVNKFKSFKDYSHNGTHACYKRMYLISKLNLELTNRAMNVGEIRDFFICIPNDNGMS